VRHRRGLCSKMLQNRQLDAAERNCQLPLRAQNNNFIVILIGRSGDNNKATGRV